ncbi:HsdM family class I SAM-dependent methyltransferase [Williamwhitmania taraxaci]|uniref:site-specific DNA-methyltransferase (adenine-specific) n=1 Tax=Williamwhitmania taraxaci TaxID=1640674 RepID=A0A1G6TNR1_9BACT|nr:N-6 DNA methylase [Williamwhitmania taraxaci]SDD30126.1 N-6 DNA Methylase [Williamwhitmania taraxaci]
MRNQVFKYLSQCSTQPNEVDRLIISGFLYKNKLAVKKNEFLKSFSILENEKEEYSTLQKFISILEIEIPKFEFEELIELFEFVISPADRIINGAIYTPVNIREFVIQQSFHSKNKTLANAKIADISCGCGGFLFSAAKQLKKKTNKSYLEIFSTQIFGLDIQPYSITRTKLLLSVLALSEGEDEKEFHFNLFEGDALKFNWSETLNRFTGFDIVLGNPPYVCARNLSDEVKLSLANWEVCKSGNPDLYIPFFQIGIECLNENGILGFITMNSFFKSLNGRALRNYFQKKSIKFKIIDFGTEQIFKSKNTYTCICIIENTKHDYIKYYRCIDKEIPKQESVFSKISYSGLNSNTGWNLQDNKIISKIESTGVAFGNIYKTRHGIATLRNDIYIFNPVKEDNDYYYLQNGSLYQIEKGICKDIVNTNKLSREVTLKNLKEKVIFPYDNSEKAKLLDEAFIKDRFPKAYLYLQNKRRLLAERDKGKGEYENWFAFGRTQSLEKVKNKMFFPKMSDRTPSYIINTDDNLLFYNGQAIIGHSEKEMLLIKKIMESRLFWYYIKTTSKPYTSNYYSLNGNYIRNFGICQLDNDELDFVLKEQDRNVLDTFFESKYDIDLRQ